MAKAQLYNESTGQMEDDPNAPQENTNTPAPSATASATPTGSWNREEFKNRWMAQGAGQNVGDWINKNQDVGQGVKFVPGSQDKVILPSGEVMDLSINSNNGVGGAGWTGMGDWHDGRINPYADAGGGAGAGAGAAAGGGVQMSAEASAKQAQDAALRAELLSRYRTRADQALNIDASTDPTIRAQADPHTAALERARRNYLADTAEQRGPLANMSGEARVTAEQTGQAAGQFESELVGREISSRRAEIADALSSMGGMLNMDEQNQLKMELAQLDAATQRLGISTNASTAARGQDLNWQGELLKNDQFNNQLGLNAADRYNYWDAVNSGRITG